jgi:hypothetical protein
MYVQYNIDSRSLKHYYRGKAISITYTYTEGDICSLSYPECNEHPPLFSSVACPAVQYFPIYLINSKSFEKKLSNTECVLWFSLQLLTETFFIIRRTERDDHKCVLIFMCNTLYSWQILMKLDFSRRGKAISITYTEGDICSLSYPECNEHPPYFHLWPVRLFNIFQFIS